MTPYLWIFAIFDAGVLVLIACELTGRTQLARRSAAALPPVAAVVLLLASFAGELAVTAYVVSQQAVPLPYPVHVPLPPIAGPIPYFDAVAAGALLLGALQTGLLLSLYRRPPPVRVVAVGAIVLTLLACGAPVIFSGDIYAYVGDGLLGLGAYAPPAVTFHGDLAAINVWWGVPLPRTVYGPLWIAVVAVVTGPFASLLGKFVALRALGVVTFAALLVVLRAYRAPPRILAVAALNPAIVFAYVTNAHNDLFGIVLVLAGGLAIRRRPAIAFLLMTAGALVKLPFAVFALPLLSRMRPIALRVAFCIAIPATAAALTWLGGGSGFLLATGPHVLTSGIAAYFTAAAGIVALAAIVVALAGGRRLRAVVWLLPLVTAFTCSWYLAWSLPYAVARHRVLGYLLVGFPLAAVALDVKFMRPWTLLAVVPALIAWQALELRGQAAKATA